MKLDEMSYNDFCEYASGVLLKYLIKGSLLDGVCKILHEYQIWLSEKKHEKEKQKCIHCKKEKSLHRKKFLNCPTSKRNKNPWKTNSFFESE